MNKKGKRATEGGLHFPFLYPIQVQKQFLKERAVAISGSFGFFHKVVHESSL